MRRVTSTAPAQDESDDPAVRQFYEDFRKRMVALRKKAKMTQAALCDLIDVPLDSYKHMEGKRASRFPLHRLGKLAAALHTTCDYLITGKHTRAVADDENRRAA